MEKQLWSNKKRDDAQKIIEWLIAYKPKPSVPLDTHRYIAIRELCCAADHSLTEAIIDRVINEMTSQSKLSISDFEGIYWNNYAQNKKPDSVLLDWRFYLPIEISSQRGVTARDLTFMLLGQEIKLLRTATVRRRTGKRIFTEMNLLTKLVGQKVNDLPAYFVYMNGHGQDWKEAWDQLAPVFDTFRGTIELTLGRGRWQFSSYDAPRRAVRHPSWMIIQGNDHSLDDTSFLTNDRGRKNQHELSKEEAKYLRQNCKLLRDRPVNGSTKEIIVDCLRLYAQALDASFSHHCFLGLWQLAESITRSEISGGDTKEVVRRIAWHAQNKKYVGSGFREILLDFSEKRNDIVHKGIHNVDEMDVNILKTICEIALIWVINIADQLPTKNHLLEFYTLRDTSNEKLKTLTESINYVYSNRKR